ncbi:MAG: helix-turn-helix transcriptional regulator [Candidatus Odinarchaeota archaeon]
MKTCQIAPYGGEARWQKLGLKKRPEVAWLILLANKPAEGMKNYLEEAKIILDDMEKEQEEFPEKQKIKFSLIDLSTISDDYHELLGCFHQLFAQVIMQDYAIQINASSGLPLWRIVLYQTALLFKECIASYFIFNKVTGEIIDTWSSSNLNDVDKAVLDILKETGRTSLTELRDKFRERENKGSLSYMVKIVSKLSEAGYIDEIKEGRMKMVSLSKSGKAISGVNDYGRILKPVLDKMDS